MPTPWCSTRWRRTGRGNDLPGGRDLTRAKRFYTEGLGCPIEKDDDEVVRLSIGDGPSTLSLRGRDALADAAGGSATGSGFPDVVLSCVVDRG